MNRAVQILELLLAERREVEAVAGNRFDRSASLQLDRLRRFGFQTKTAARDWLKSRRGKIADKKPIPEQETAAPVAQTVPLFADYAKGWLAASQAKGLKQTTLRDYRSIVKIQLIPAFGLLPRPTPAGTLLDYDHRRHVHPLDRKSRAR
jgi:hypothetical protein